MEHRLADAQSITAIRIADVLYARLAYGKERAPWDFRVPCHDCNARIGQLHVVGCDVEECPRCARQLVTCDCLTGPGRDRDDDDEGDGGESLGTLPPPRTGRAR